MHWGSFCPEDFERCQRRASQDLYRKLMLPVETEPNSHRSERGECGRKQSLFSKISHSTCSSCILMLLLWHIWASCSYNLTIRPDFRHFWGASHKALKMYFLSFLMLFHRVSLTAIYCIWKMFVNCQNWLSVNKSAAESWAMLPTLPFWCFSTTNEPLRLEMKRLLWRTTVCTVCSVLFFQVLLMML